MIPSFIRRARLPRSGGSSSASSFNPFTSASSSSASSSTASSPPPYAFRRASKRGEEPDVFQQAAAENASPSSLGASSSKSPPDWRADLPAKPRFIDPDDREVIHPRAREKAEGRHLREGTFGLDAPLTGPLASLTPYLAPSTLPPATSSTPSYTPLTLDAPTLRWFSKYTLPTWHRHLTAIESPRLRRDHILKAKLFRKALKFRTPQSQEAFLALTAAKLAEHPDVARIRQMVASEVKYKRVALKPRAGEERMLGWDWASLPEEEKVRRRAEMRRQMIEDAEEGSEREGLVARFEAEDEGRREQKRRVEERVRLLEEAREAQGRGEEVQGWKAEKEKERIGGGDMGQ